MQRYHIKKAAIFVWHRVEKRKLIKAIFDADIYSEITKITIFINNIM